MLYKEYILDGFQCIFRSFRYIHYKARIKKLHSFSFILSVFICIFLSSNVWGLNVSLPYTEDFDDDSYVIDGIVYLASGGVPGGNGQTHTHLPSGGWSGGAAHFTPPHTQNYGGNGGYTGIGSIDFSAEPTVYIRFLIRWASNWEENSLGGAYGYQDKIVMTNAASGNRGMTIFERCSAVPCGSNNYYTLGACEDNTCIYQGDPTRYSPRGNDLFKSSDYPEEWVSFELMVSSSGTTRIYITTQDGALSGLYMELTGLSFNNTIRLEGVGWFFNGLFSPGTWFEIDELKIDTSYIGPPAGFIGSPAGSQHPMSPDNLQITP